MLCVVVAILLLINVVPNFTIFHFTFFLCVCVCFFLFHLIRFYFVPSLCFYLILHFCWSKALSLSLQWILIADFSCRCFLYPFRSIFEQYHIFSYSNIKFVESLAMTTFPMDHLTSSLFFPPIFHIILFYFHNTGKFDYAALFFEQ